MTKNEFLKQVDFFTTEVKRHTIVIEDISRFLDLTQNDDCIVIEKDGDSRRYLQAVGKV